MDYEVAIVGGGLVGLATALALVERGRPPLVLEAEDELARHQSGRNSGVIHAGLYYRPGSTKARTCVEGREALYAFCDEHGVPYERRGKLVIATDDAELPALAELERRARGNGLVGVERLDAAGIRSREPHARGVAGLWVPQTGVVDYRRVAAAMAGAVRAGGGEIRTGTRVESVRRERDAVYLETAAGDVRCAFLVGCAGLASDRLARRCGLDPAMRVVPFRGDYYRVVPERSDLVRGLIYPVPDPRLPFLGVHFTRRVDDVVEAGPNAVLALARTGYGRFSVDPRDAVSTLAFPGFWRLARRHWRTGIGELARSLSRRRFAAALRRLVPEIRARDLEPAGCGIRAQMVERDGRLIDDFVMVVYGRTLHVLNAPSPAATASLAISRRIATRVVDALGD